MHESSFFDCCWGGVLVAHLRFGGVVNRLDCGSARVLVFWIFVDVFK